MKEQMDHSLMMISHKTNEVDKFDDDDLRSLNEDEIDAIILREAVGEQDDAITVDSDDMEDCERNDRSVFEVIDLTGEDW